MLLFNYAESPDCSIGNGLGDGLFLRWEKLLLDFLCGMNEGGKAIEFRGRNYDARISGVSLILNLLGKGSAWLSGVDHVNPYCVHQYLVGHWEEDLIANPETLGAFQKNPTDIAKLGRYCSTIKTLGAYAKFKTQTINITDEPRKVFAAKVIAFLDSDEAPKRLKELWQEAESKV